MEHAQDREVVEQPAKAGLGGYFGNLAVLGVGHPCENEWEGVVCCPSTEPILNGDSCAEGGGASRWRRWLV